MSGSDGFFFHRRYIVTEINHKEIIIRTTFIVTPARDVNHPCPCLQKFVQNIFTFSFHGRRNDYLQHIVQ